MSSDPAHGAWPSIISAARVVEGSIRIGEIVASGTGVWWSESRPSEGGRTQIVRRGADGACRDVLPDGYSARTLVHEYGGAAWWCDGETLFFANQEDQRLYRLDPGAEPVPLTPSPRRSRGRRYADGSVTVDHRWIVCVAESHPGEDDVPDDATEPANVLVAVPVDGGEVTVLRADADFVASPRISPDGSTLAWLEWSHPDMPWDRTAMWVASLHRERGAISLDDLEAVVDTPHESVCQPEWDPDGRLWFISDRNDWWNLFHFDAPGRPAGAPSVVTSGPFEVGVPQWVFGQSRYAFVGDRRMVFAYTSDGVDRLGAYDLVDRRFDHVATESTSISQLRSHGAQLLFVGGSYTAEPAVIGSPFANATLTGPRRFTGDNGREHLSSAWISVGRSITFPTTGGAVAHGIYYPPMHPEVSADPDERPPLIVAIHGGPTAAAAPVLNLRTQYWTSRGYAVVDVNYRGSTGFGRAYRDALAGGWGVVDVDDCRAAAEYLVAQGRADGDRLLIRGSSAGGFTVLASLVASDIWAAGCSLYGVADAERLALDTHKFEARYLDGLIAPYPERRDVYEARSPLHAIDRIDTPVILFQGSDDVVVPPAQSERMVDALDARGVPHAFVRFEGEGHGFRRAENMIACLDGERSFYEQILGLPHDPDLPVVPITHLDAGGE